MRTINLNSQYLVVMKLRRDLNGLKVLGNQLMPGMSKEFMSVYNECTTQKYSYLLINIHPANSVRISLHTNIFKDEIEFVYTPK